MTTVHVQLFGRFIAQVAPGTMIEFDSSKAEELFCYLLLNRGRPHHREALMSLLWSDTDRLHARRYLRKALWQLQSAVKPDSVKSDEPLFLIDPDWVEINWDVRHWVDAVILEETYDQVQGLHGSQLDESQLHTLEEAVDLYRGDLLEARYQEWCIFERERLKRIQLLLLDKLVESTEFRGQHEKGIHFATRILQFDEARERTHRCLMRLYMSAGDRTTALRQYEICVTVLAEELGVLPAARTDQLYELIRLGSRAKLQADLIPSRPSSLNRVLLLEALDQLHNMQASINSIHDLLNQINKPVL